MDEKMISIGERIKSRRKELGLTQLDIKASCGISSGALSSIENGGRTPSVIAFSQIAQALQCSMDWLATGTSPNTETVSFSKSEEALLNDFRQLSLDDQEEIRDIIALKLKRTKRTESGARSSHSEGQNISDKLA